MKKFFKIVGIIFLSIILLIVLVLGYFGFIPGVSTLFGSDRPRDLGVRYTPVDLKHAQAKLGQTTVSATQNPFEQLKSSGGNPVDTFLTQEEYSAHAQRIHPVSNLQIKLHGSSFEISGKLDKARIPQFVRTWGLTTASDHEILDAVNKYLPVSPIFYIKGTGGVKNNNLTINLSKAEFGRMGVSTEQAQQIIKAYTETLFQQVSSFSVEDSSVENGKLHFKGSILKEIPEY